MLPVKETRHELLLIIVLLLVFIFVSGIGNTGGAVPPEIVVPS